MTIASRGDDLYMLRLPNGLRERIRLRAQTSGRSLNTEIIIAIEHHLATAKTPSPNGTLPKVNVWTP
jgi:plasmid stability protein